MSSSSPPPSSPQRHRGGGDNSNSGKEERPRFFDSMTKKLCWAKADIVPGRHPERWRKDAAGNVVCKRFGNCQGCLCFEYDHIIPFSKGGESVVENCQILQTRVNRTKSDKDHLDKTQLRGYSCDINFTEKELDIIEMAVYGDVIRPGNQCRCRSIDELLGNIVTVGKRSRDQRGLSPLVFAPGKHPLRWVLLSVVERKI
ncbi:unnamed protein product [Lactuca saligna]|uniref:HNH domain-containing protein n=1 Tax=Lactuca saligna TaxID=75948 RepID=A0AA35Z220_LACSI|nr:unnamed protein product [Lactuca saligna]